jgi:hypothetical protein
VIDLLPHGARQRHQARGDGDQIVLGHFPVLQPRLGQSRYDALLDFGPGPAVGELGQQVEVEPGRIDAAPAEVDSENLEALFLERQVDEEDLVEAAFADHLGGQQVDAVGGGGDEKPARLLLHPGQEEGENAALFAADSVAVRPISISSNQSTAGARSSIILHAWTNTPSGLPCLPEKISIMSTR